MDRDVEGRIAANEAVFREVNEAIARGLWPGEADAPTGFRCECANLGCNSVIEMTLREYEGVRSHPRRFIVAIGHEAPEAETVIQTTPGYTVVEKLRAAGDLAESLDPRD